MSFMANELPYERMIREPERRAITGLGRTSWHEMERAGKTPKKYRIGPRAVGWKLSDLLKWVAEREVV